MDEVTSEQGYIDAERSCFWRWDDNEYNCQSRPFKSRQVIRREPVKFGQTIPLFQTLHGFI